MQFLQWTYIFVFGRKRVNIMRDVKHDNKRLLLPKIKTKVLLGGSLWRKSAWALKSTRVWEQRFSIPTTCSCKKVQTNSIIVVQIRAFLPLISVLISQYHSQVPTTFLKFWCKKAQRSHQTYNNDLFNVIYSFLCIQDWSITDTMKLKIMITSKSC